MANAPIVLNLTADEASDAFALAEPGVYKVEIEEANYGTSNAGNPKIELVLKSLEDSYKGKFFTNVTLTAKAARFALIPLMKALGHEVEAGALTVPVEDELVGKEVAVRIAKSYSYKDGVKPDGKDNWVNVKESEVEDLEKSGIEVKKRNEVKTFAPVAGGAKKAGAKSSKFSL